MQFIQQQIFCPQRPLFQLTPAPRGSSAGNKSSLEFFPYFVNERGEIITVDTGSAGNFTFYAKKIKGRGLTRGRRVKTRPASWFPNPRQALVALNDYAPARGWAPARTLYAAMSIACSRNR